MPIDRTIYFDRIRPLFGGSMTQEQVDGQNAILNGWEQYRSHEDMRWLANFLGQTYHETAQRMTPIAEYGGENASYGQPDPVTGERYYGRGFIQITHKENYERADRELNLVGAESCVAHADNQLRLDISGRTGYLGMVEGWFRSDHMGPHTLPRYFNAKTNDAYGSRQIINGDSTKVPSWSNGVSIGNLIVKYHNAFMDALVEAYYTGLPPDGDEEVTVTINVLVDAPPGVRVAIVVNTPET